MVHQMQAPMACPAMGAYFWFARSEDSNRATAPQRRNQQSSGLLVSPRESPRESSRPAVRSAQILPGPAVFSIMAMRYPYSRVRFKKRSARAQRLPQAAARDEDGTIVNPGGNVAPGLNRGDKIDKPDNPNKPDRPENPGAEGHP